MITFLKRNWFLILLALIATLVGFIWTYNRPRPQEAPPVPISPLSENTGSATFTIEVTEPAVPRSMPIFSVQKFSQTLIPPYVESVRSQFGLLKTAPSLSREDLVVWQSPEITLALDLPSGYFNLYQGSIKIANSFNEAAAKTYASQEAISLGLLQKIKSSTLGYFASDGDPHLEEATPETANVYLIQLSGTINNVPLISVAQNQNQVEFRLTKNGELIKLSFHSPVPGQQVETKETVPWTTAVKDLQNNRAFTVFLKDKDGETPTPLAHDPLRSGTIANSYIAYLDPADTTQDILQPVYIFEGEGVAVSGGKRVFSLYVPATNYVSR